LQGKKLPIYTCSTCSTLFRKWHQTTEVGFNSNVMMYSETLSMKALLMRHSASNEIFRSPFLLVFHSWKFQVPVFNKLIYSLKTSQQGLAVIQFALTFLFLHVHIPESIFPSVLAGRYKCFYAAVNSLSVCKQHTYIYELKSSIYFFMVCQQLLTSSLRTWMKLASNIRTVAEIYWPISLSFGNDTFRWIYFGDTLQF